MLLFSTLPHWVTFDCGKLPFDPFNFVEWQPRLTLWTLLLTGLDKPVTLDMGFQKKKLYLAEAQWKKNAEAPTSGCYNMVQSHHS